MTKVELITDDEQLVSAHYKSSGTNTCQMCQYYTVPGWIINAWEIIPCFECNPGNKQGQPKPRSLAETAIGQATHEARIRKEGRP